MIRQKTSRFLALTGIAMLTAWSTIEAATTSPLGTDTKPTHTPAGFTQDEIKKLSEAFGHFIGRNLNNPGIQFDLESIIKGMREGVAGDPAPMSDQEYEKMMAKLQESAFKQLADDNQKAADSFMEKNANAEGIVVLEPNKLQYLVLQKGDGAEVKSDSVPQIKYVGKYIDGTIFGSSEEVGGPITIPLSQTIPGFSKGLVGMKEGEKRRLFVHPELGYGQGGQLPPNALLIFDIEVVKADTPNYKNSFGKNVNPKNMPLPPDLDLDEDEDDDGDDDDDDDDADHDEIDHK